MVAPNERDERKRVDRTPSVTNHEAYSPHTMGDPQVEYGIVDLSHHFPSESYEWTPEYPGDEIEEHEVVPFRVVKRGFTQRETAKSAAKSMEEDSERNYKVVVVSDTRGI